MFASSDGDGEGEELSRHRVQQEQRRDLTQRCVCERGLSLGDLPVLCTETAQSVSHSGRKMMLEQVTEAWWQMPLACLFKAPIIMVILTITVKI